MFNYFHNISSIYKIYILKFYFIIFNLNIVYFID